MQNLKQRLFFALSPDAATRAAVAEAIQFLRPLPSAHWIRPENLHITLAFLGDVEAQRLDAVTAAADNVQAQGFTLLLDSLDHWRKPQILCLCPSAAMPPLQQLAADLSGQLQAAGFAPEERPYRAHLTLARHVPHLPADARLQQPIPWPANAFALLASSQDRRGLVYSVLKTWPLLGLP